VADQRVLAKKVTSQAQFEAKWAYFGLQGTSSERQWDNKAAIFLGVTDKPDGQFIEIVKG
jgi:hypothetical protein